MTPIEALAEIESKCKRAEAGGRRLRVKEMRALLADVQPEPTFSLTAQEAALAAYALRNVRGWPVSGQHDHFDDAITQIRQREALAARLEMVA